MRMVRRRNVNPVLVEALEDRCLFSASLLHPFSTKVVAHPHAKVRPAAAPPASIVGQLGAATTVTASTIPADGDLNPYGVSFVPQGFPKGGPLNPGDVLVSNFNDSANEQGTGTTIVRVTPSGSTSTFFQSATPVGLSTGLQVLKSGFVVVGNLPSDDGTSATAHPGSLIILDKFGFEVANCDDLEITKRPTIYCGSPSTANERNFAYLSPTLRSSLYCAEFRQF